MHVQFNPEYRWRLNTKGNHVMMEGDIHRATVFRTRGQWRIIVNGFGVSRIAADEFFDDEKVAMHRTEMIVDGAVDDARMAMIPRRP